jgi:hypothetical protein
MGEVSNDDITKALFMGSRDVLFKHGLDDDFWARRMKKLAKAKKIDTFKATKKELDGEGNIISQTEEVIYSVPMDAHDIQLKATIQIGNLLGHVAVEKRELTGGGGGPINVSMEAGPEIQGLIERIRQSTLAEEEKPSSGDGG